MEPGNASKEDVAVIGKDLSNLEKDFVVIGKDLSKLEKEVSNQGKELVNQGKELAIIKTKMDSVATRESLKDMRVSIVLWTIGIVVVAIAALGGYINYLNNMGQS